MTKLGRHPLSPDFRVYEFACWCPPGEEGGCHGAVGMIDDDLVEVLQELRDWLHASIRLSSAYRCDHRNAKKGGHRFSYHRLGQAADCTSRAVRTNLDAFALKAAEILERRYGNARGNVIIYRTRGIPFVHVDVGRRVAELIREKD
jgi:uncharacterized protein YcbK (DUF882 family)